MAQNQEVERIAKKLDKMVHKKNTDGALDLLRELKDIKMSLETLQSTRVGMSVNAVRKQSSEEEVQTLAKGLIKSWKKLLEGSDGKPEQKKKDGSPVRSLSSSRDSSCSEKSTMSGETPTTPSSPAPPPRVTSFPPAPVTTDSVRNKCRELLVAALQTDDDHKAADVDCEHLAAQIEDHILSHHQRQQTGRDGECRAEADPRGSDQRVHQRASAVEGRRQRDGHVHLQQVSREELHVHAGSDPQRRRTHDDFCCV
ncbi:transcription elongation factor A protein 2 isoform X2 [Brachyistius frenatus]|uniref:transcription elongation factor A protein 2 isoform X2 n=1 Tax=Brachyistius frenatus TaxID=100188 RepID=UPI0037E8AB5D